MRIVLIFVFLSFVSLSVSLSTQAGINIPAQANTNTDIVVLLHGCKQDAEEFSKNTGWIDKSNELGFILYYPQQSKKDNSLGCFNWFAKENQTRTQGEAKKIVDEVLKIKNNNGITHNKVFVVGLSAGAAMANILLSIFPDIFTAGGIVAGTPFKCSESSLTALICMQGWVSKSSYDWANLVMNSYSHSGEYPKVSIWHGDQDSTVRPRVSDEIVKQWIGIHGISDIPTKTTNEVEYGFKDFGGTIELHRLKGLGHAYFIDQNNCGAEGPYVEYSKKCITRELLKFFAILP